PEGFQGLRTLAVADMHHRAAFPIHHDGQVLMPSRSNTLVDMPISLIEWVVYTTTDQTGISTFCKPALIKP
ncbi:MAG: hypothetical protein AB7I48_00220, partial [Planctomycetaceae bacterium]